MAQPFPFARSNRSLPSCFGGVTLSMHPNCVFPSTPVHYDTWLISLIRSRALSRGISASARTACGGSRGVAGLQLVV